MVYSLWITRRFQFGPAPLGEIMRPETPLEVFGLVPIPPPALRALPGWRVSLTPPGERTPVPLVVTAIEFGRVPIDAADAKLIFPDLPVTRESIFCASEARRSAAARAMGRAAPDHVDVARASAPVALAQRRLSPPLGVVG